MKINKCLNPNCDKLIAKKRECGTCQSRRLRNGSYELRKRKPNKCLNPNCNNLTTRKECITCYNRRYETGSYDYKGRKRTRFFNQKFLDTWSKEMSYFLGWVATDGNISKDLRYLRIGITDKEILYRFKEIIGDCQIKERYRGEERKLLYTLTLGSKYLCTKAVELGIPPKKSLILKMPYIPEEFFYHFFRGVIEGDGSICRAKRDNRLVIVLNSASKDFIDAIKNKIPIQSSYSVKIKENRINPIYRLTWTGKYANELCKLMYQDSENLRLTRKYDKWINKNEIYN